MNGDITLEAVRQCQRAFKLISSFHTLPVAQLTASKGGKKRNRDFKNEVKKRCEYTELK